MMSTANNEKRRFLFFLPGGSKIKLFALIAVGVIALIGASVWLKHANAPEARVIQPRRGEIVESFTEPARTQLDRDHRITMPVAGRIGRIDLVSGDAVKAGQELATFDRLPLEANVAEARAALAELDAEIRVKNDNRLEETGLINMNAWVDATSETLKAAQMQVDAQEARHERAMKELARVEEMAADQSVAEARLDDARLEAETSLSQLREEQYNLASDYATAIAVNLGPRFIREYIDKKALERDTLEQRRAQQEAHLKRTTHDLQLARIESPIDGVVLKRYDQGDRFLPAGQELLLIGDLSRLEVVADVLTQDALRLKPGSEVILEPAARLASIPGRVKRIEPHGFTKLSSLGVEQQRVNVIADLDATDALLGVGYRLQARFITGRKPDALIVPRFSILQDSGGTFYVFKVERNQLVRQDVEIGLRGDLDLEIVSGLDDEDEIVATPDSTMSDGDAIKPLRDENPDE